MTLALVEVVAVVKEDPHSWDPSWHSRLEGRKLMAAFDRPPRKSSEARWAPGGTEVSVSVSSIVRQVYERMDRRSVAPNSNTSLKQVEGNQKSSEPSPLSQISP